MSSLRRLTSIRLTPSTAIAFCALFVATAGTAWAAATIGSTQIIDNSIRSIDIRNGSVQAADLGLYSVGSDEVAGNSLQAGDLAANAVGTSELQTAAVTSDKIADGSVGAAQLSGTPVTLVTGFNYAEPDDAAISTVFTGSYTQITATCNLSGIQTTMDIGITSTEAGAVTTSRYAVGEDAFTSGATGVDGAMNVQIAMTTSRYASGTFAVHLPSGDSETIEWSAFVGNGNDDPDKILPGNNVCQLGGFVTAISAD